MKTSRSGLRVASVGAVVVAVSILTIVSLPLLAGAQPPEPEAASGGYCYGLGVAGYPVPEYGDRLIHGINLSDCPVPPDARVSRIEVVARIETDFAPSGQCSDCLGQLRVSLANSQYSRVVHEYDQDCCSTGVTQESPLSAAAYTCTLTELNFTQLNGETVARKWFIIVEKGCATASSYRLLDWEITVHYEGAPPATPTSTQTPTPNATATPTATTYAPSCYASNDTQVPFPSANTWINSPITIVCAPPGATVTGVDVQVNVVHDCPQATRVELRYGGRTLVLWNRQGTCGGVSYYSALQNGVSTFNGLPANGTWQAYAVDEVGYGSQYYLDFWNITVRYGGGGTATPTPTAGPSVTPKPPPPPTCRNMLSNGDFESGELWPWLPYESAGLGPGRGSDHGGWIGGETDTNADLHRWVTIPSVLSPLTLRFWWMAEADTPQAGDVLHAFFERGEELNTLSEIHAAGPLGQWEQAEADLSPYAGQSGFLLLIVHNDHETPSTFMIDDVEMVGCGYFLDLPLIMSL